MMLKIGLIIYGNLNILSGGYLYDKKLVSYLREEGVEVTIFSQPLDTYLAHLKDNLSTSFFQAIYNYAPDILLQDELNHPSLFLMNRALKKHLNCPIISIVHHLYNSESSEVRWKRLLPWVEQRYLKTVDGFIFNSQTTQRTVEDFLMDRNLKSTVAYPGKDNLTFDLDEQTIECRSRREKPLNLIFVGNIITRKSLHVLINSLALLPPSEWQLTVVGDRGVNPAYTKRIDGLIYNLQLAESVQFVGKVSRKTLQKHLEKSDVLVVPSVYEGFGIVYVEALGAGLPVIAGKAGGATEIIKSGENGYLVSQNTYQLANIINRFIENRSLLTAMSLAAYESYDRFPTWDKSMARALTFIKSFCPHD